MKVLFLCPYPLEESPSQRFRFEQYFSLLKEHNIAYEVSPFFDLATWRSLYVGGYAKKITGSTLGYLRRFKLLFSIHSYDIVFLHREITPIGPPVLEWIISKVFKKKIIYDFDDAIWHTDLDRTQWFKIWFRNASKTNKIIKWSWKVSCGNEYLCQHARKFNSNVWLNPTTIDTEQLHNHLKDQATGRIVIGWTGSHSTLKYLMPLVPVIKKLEADFDFDFLVICNVKPEWNLKSLKFLPWKKETEIKDLMNFHIGLMPLPDDEWAKGKCGFKALQYMALGMPALVSPVGVNTEIVTDGKDGFICATEEDWIHAIRLLIKDQSLRASLGKNAREKVVDRYSVLSNAQNFLLLFQG